MTSYVSLWNTIKTTGLVEFTVNRDRAETVIMGVKKAKSAENTARRRVLGRIGWSKLVITKVELSPTHIRVTMKLLYDTNL